MSLTRSDLDRFAKKPHAEPFEVKNEGTIYIRELSGNEAVKLGALYDEFSDAEGRNAATAKLQIRICALCMVDEDYERLYSDDEEDALGRLPNSVIADAFQVCLRVNGFTKKEAEKIAGESEAAQDGS